MVIPLIASAAIKAAPAILGAIGNGVGGGPIQTLGQEDRDNAIDHLDQGAKRGNQGAIAGANIAGVQSSPGGRQSGKDVKKANNGAAAVEYLMGKEGLTQEQAQKRLADLRNSGKKIGDVPGYKKWLNEVDPSTGQKRGDVYGLSVEDGKIKGTARAVAGSTSAPSDSVKEGVNDINNEVIDANKGLATGYADEARRGIGYRDDYRNKIAQATNYDPNGLTPEDNSFLESFKNQGVNDILSFTKDRAQEVFGNFANTGFKNSSLAANAFGNEVIDPSNRSFERFANQLYQQKEDILNQRQDRNASRVGTLVSGISSSGPSSLADTFNLTNPEAGGAMSDADATKVGLDVGINNRDYEYGRGKDKANVDLTPDSYYSPPRSNK